MTAAGCGPGFPSVAHSRSGVDGVVDVDVGRGVGVGRRGGRQEADEAVVVGGLGQVTEGVRVRAVAGACAFRHLYLVGHVAEALVRGYQRAVAAVARLVRVVRAGLRARRRRRHGRTTLRASSDSGVTDGRVLKQKRCCLTVPCVPREFFRASLFGGSSFSSFTRRTLLALEVGGAVML